MSVSDQPNRVRTPSSDADDGTDSSGAARDEGEQRGRESDGEVEESREEFYERIGDELERSLSQD